MTLLWGNFCLFVHVSRAITPILKDWKFLSTFYLNSNIVTIFLFSGGYSLNTSFWGRIFNGRIRSRKIRLQLISNFFVYSCHFKTNFTQTAFWKIPIQSQSVVKILWRPEVNRFKGDWKLSIALCGGSHPFFKVLHSSCLMLHNFGWNACTKKPNCQFSLLKELNWTLRQNLYWLWHCKSLALIIKKKKVKKKNFFVCKIIRT